MEAIKTLKFMLPAFWASYLINDDASGMDEGEIKAVDQWMKQTRLPAPAACSDEIDFFHWHDARDVYPYASDCAVFTFLIHASD